MQDIHVPFPTLCLCLIALALVLAPVALAGDGSALSPIARDCAPDRLAHVAPSAGEVLVLSLGAVEVKPTLGELTPWPWTARRVRKGEWYELHPRRWTMFSRSAAPATRGDL